MAAVAVAGFVGMFWSFDYGADWNWLELDYRTFWTPLGQLRNATFNGLHAVLPWMAFAWVGMAAARLDLRQPAVRRGLVWAGAAMAAVAWAASAWLSAQPDERGTIAQFEQWYRAPARFWGLSSVPPGPLFVLSGLGASLLAIGVMLSICTRRRWRSWLQPLIACGQMALTLYVAHVLFLFFVAMPIRDEVEAAAALSPEGKLRFTLAAVLAFWAFALGGSWWWRSTGRRGPLESLMRRLAG